MFLVWRAEGAVYAETVKAPLENKNMRLTRAYAYTIELAQCIAPCMHAVRMAPRCE
jgi:hypothetical protein